MGYDDLSEISDKSSAICARLLKKGMKKEQPDEGCSRIRVIKLRQFDAQIGIYNFDSTTLTILSKQRWCISSFHFLLLYIDSGFCLFLLFI